MDQERDKLGNFYVEACTICKKRLVTAKGKRGRIDHKAYYMEHLRNFLQRGSRLYMKEYGVNKPYVKKQSSDEDDGIEWTQ